MATILIFTSNEQIAHKLCDSFNKEKYDVRLCSDQNELLKSAMENPAPLVLLDAAMKWTACRPLLERGQELDLSVLFITGDHRMSAHLRALYGGRSDVLVAPYSQKALHAKANSLLGASVPPRELSVDEKERVAHLDGRRVELTAQEMSLLLALLAQPDIPVSREQLLRKAWGYQSMGETRTVDVHVQRLRKKLGDECIETVYKCGYRLKLA